MSLQKFVSKPTRTTCTQHSSTLIDHIITNIPNQVTHTDVISSLMISDHDAPYVCINVRITRFVPRYKFIRNEKNFNADAFIEDFEQLPLSIVYSTDDPDMQVDLLSSLIRECIDRHAPLKRTKVTRPPAPWMKDLDIQQLQKDCLSLQTSARVSKDEVTWTRYRDMRNELKSKIKKTKREFYQKALSSSKPKEIWQVIHRILHPSPQPLRVEPEELNSFFASSAERVTGASAIPTNELWKLIDSLPKDEDNSFHLRKVTCKEVLSELKKLRNDCSCGPDSIPVKFLKMAAEKLTPSLTHILNNCIDNLTFPSA